MWQAKWWQRRDRPKRSCTNGMIFHAICTARPRLGVSERSLSVLNALLTFHPETALTGEDDLIVFPSNDQLTLRAHGMPASTLRRHLAVLVDAGLIIRRDSPNGKRYARKGGAGEIELAFGFDLSPLVVRSEEFEQPGGRHRSRSARAQACARAHHAVPARHRQDDCHRHRGRRPDAQGRAGAGRLAGSPRRLPRNRRPDSADRDAASSSSRSPTSCLNLPTTCSIFWKHTSNPRIRAPMSSHSERHIQNSNTDTLIDLEPSLQEGRAARAEPKPQPSRVAEGSYPLGMVLNACPDIVDYAKGGISNWRDFLATAAVVRSMLGISPSAWEEAQTVLGETQAAIVVACILQRGDRDQIRWRLLARADAESGGRGIFAWPDSDVADQFAAQRKATGVSDGGTGNVTGSGLRVAQRCGSAHCRRCCRSHASR